MRRRTVLTTGAACVSSVAGCSRSDSQGTNPDDTDPSPTETQRRRDDQTITEPRTETPIDEEIQRTVTLTEQSDGDLRGSFGIGAQVSVLESSVTPEHTARIQILLDNQTVQSQTLSYTRERCDLNMVTGHSRSDGASTVLLVSTEQAWERTAVDCWVPDERSLNCGIPALDHDVTIAPDDPVRWTFRVWASPEDYRNGFCLPRGFYQFERALRQEGTRADLSFTLSIETG